MKIMKLIFLTLSITNVFAIIGAGSSNVPDHRLLRFLLLKRTLNLGNRYDARFNVGKKYVKYDDYSWNTRVNSRRRRAELFQPNYDHRYADDEFDDFNE